jgi:hypothetical protein
VVAAVGLEVALARIRSVGIEPRGLNPFSGALRKRLRVETDDGSVELFVVQNVDEVQGRLSEAVQGR